MEDFRSSFSYSGGDRRQEIVSGKGYNGNQMYTVTRPRSPDLPPVPARVTRLSEVGSSAPSKPWGFSDPEMKRRKRIARYKVYTIEGRFKTSFKNGFRWIKNKCSEFIHGY